MTPRARIAIAALAVGLLGAARPAAAHPLDIGYLRLHSDGAALSITLDLHVSAAAQLLGRDPSGAASATGATGSTGIATATAIVAHAAELADATFRAAPLTTPHGPCRFTTATASVANQTASLVGRAECPSPIRAIHWPFPFVHDARVSPTFQILVK